MKDLVCWKCETLIGKTTCDKDQDVVCTKCMHKRGVTIHPDGTYTKIVPVTKHRNSPYTGVWKLD